MGKKKVVLYGVAALFAVSGVVALPSGNITGGIGCIVIAAVCFLLARKPEKEAAGQQATPRTTGAPAAGSRIAETIRTKVTGSVCSCPTEPSSFLSVSSRAGCPAAVHADIASSDSPSSSPVCLLPLFLICLHASFLLYCSCLLVLPA